MCESRFCLYYLLCYGDRLSTTNHILVMKKVAEQCIQQNALYVTVFKSSVISFWTELESQKAAIKQIFNLFIMVITCFKFN